MKRPQVKSFRPLLWLTIPALLGLAGLGGTLALLSGPITLGTVPSAHAAGDPRYYDIGSPTLTEVWVDPVNGNNNNTGNSRPQALQTLNEAWVRIPQGVTLTTTGYHIKLVAGVYPESSLPNYLESRYGAYQFPIIIQAADGSGTAILGGDLNVFDTRYLYLLDLNITPNPPGDALHCERCNHLLVRNTTLNGGNRVAHETVKINQSQYIYLEDNNISGADDNPVDFVAVQYGHIQGNRIHNGQDWCLYLKGGSAYFRVEGNEFYNCGTGGFTAGQGTGFEFMESPWLHYEAYDIKFINNIVHDIEGAGMGVNGGYNILLAYNTLYRVGQRSHVIEAVHGRRGCDGNTAACNSHLAAGGWGESNVDGVELEIIPNRNIYIYNNIVYNPPGFQSQYQHFAVQGPVTPPGGTNVPSPSLADNNLVIAGNIIWNGPSNHLLGIEDTSQGCQPANPTCNATQLVMSNTINTLEPQLVAPALGYFQPITGSNIFSATPYTIPNFTWADAPAPPIVPSGTLTNTVTLDRAGAIRSSSHPPGAYLNPISISISLIYLPVILRNQG